MIIGMSGTAQDVTEIKKIEEKLTENIKNSKLYTLHNIGHIPMIEDYGKFDNAFIKALQE